MGHSKSNSKRVYSDASLLQEIKKNSNKKKNLTLHRKELEKEE